MRTAILTAAISVCAISLVAAETPREFAKRFYAAHQTWPIRGVPTTEQEELVSRFLGAEIIHAFRRVNEHRRLEAEQFDPENPMKPRWCMEGNVFCDNWEGITRFSIGKAKRREGRWIVEAHLEYVEGGISHPWTDRLVLDRSGEDWVLADIEYNRGGTLLTLILEELTEADAEIPKNNKGEQGGADQPATALESKPQGNQKPKPESEVRPQ